jgi:hypothetical protein
VARAFELLGQNFGLVRGKVSLHPLVNKGGMEIGDFEKYRVSFQKWEDWGWREVRKADHLVFFVVGEVSGENLREEEVYVVV